MTIKSVKFMVSGVVQGVGFRYHTCNEGLKLHLTGYAKNLANGDVEVVACGEPEQLEQLEQWLQTGPKTSRVDRVDKEAISLKEYISFEIL
ncbi:acylphosphatase [Vibrio sinensis]|uniref:Acylphosphatase n=1 Tax=Vibrio sinensis TaxID=2302434 RepID=A0A3A6QNK6_9VIBR|nr:acylphosphatase [Vibrio sinensis]RJX72848.1 acylphosphatase [Vibrio sinensis]